MIKVFLALGVFCLTLAVFAQDVETEVDKSYDKCLQKTMLRFEKARGEELSKEHGAIASSTVKRTSCDEATMTCKITGYFQYDNAQGKKVVISGQEVAFKTNDKGLCIEGILKGKPSSFILKGQ